jgi:DNA mismatch repair ATPase MutS
MVEAEGVVSLLQDAETAPPTLYLLDELLRGTNTVERIAAGEAVVRALAAPNGTSRGHTVFVATHDGELVTLLRDRLAACHFRETIDASGMHFDYARHEGAARTRTAMALLAACGAPASVLTAARDRAAQLDALTMDPL